MLSCHSSRTFLLISSIVVCLIPCGTAATDQSLSPETQALLESSRRAFANDRFDDAVKFAKKATELEPDASACQLWLGIAYSEKTETGWFGSKLLNARRCRKAFQRAVALDSSSLDAREGLIEFHVRAPGIAGGNMETAWSQVEFIMQHDSLRGHLAAAFIHERKDEDTSAAETALLSAVAVDTSNMLAQLRLAGFYVRSGERDKAESVLTSAAERGDREALLNLCWLFYAEGGGSEILQSILVEDPHDSDVLFFLAERHLGRGEFGAGDSLIAILAEFTGECPELKFLHAIGASTTRYEPSDAVIDDLKNYLNSEPCIQYDPCWANPHLLAGIYSHRPSRARIHYMLSGFFKRISGKSKNVKKHLERALELDPTYWPARRALNMSGMNL